MVCMVGDELSGRTIGMEHLKHPSASVVAYQSGVGSGVPLIRSAARTRIYCTISLLLAADSRTLFPLEPPASKVTYPGISPSIV